MIHSLRFMTHVLRLALLACTSICLLEAHASRADERQFLMGLTPMNFDESPAGTERMTAALATNADAVAIYLDWGVPWPEAFEGQPFHENVRKEIAAVKQRISPQHQVFLALNAGAFNRREMAGYWGEKTQMPRPGLWADKGLDDPDVFTAFGNYCERMIAEFQPTFLCYAISGTWVNQQVRTDSSPPMQAAYVGWLLAESNRLDARLVTWFFPEDINMYLEQEVKRTPEAAGLAALAMNLGLHD